MPEGAIVCCDSTDADFNKAKSVQIRDKGESFTLNKFVMGIKRQCFNLNYPVAPVFKPEEDIPENFLRRGNEVVFGF
jgi:hypothetical protein